MYWRDMRIVAFDTETTGLHPKDGHRVIEFGAVEFMLNPDGSINKTVPHHYMFNPQMLIPKEASDVCGIYDKDVANCPTFDKSAKEVFKILHGAVTIAHNYPFDRCFLAWEFQLVGMEWPNPPAEIDTYDMSVTMFPQADNHKLVTLAKRLEIPYLRAHRATDDAEVCGRSFLEMTRINHAPSDLTEMLDWSGGIGKPPDTGHLRLDKIGRVVFAYGEHEGCLITEHPDVLMWMTTAMQFEGGAWRRRFPEGIRTWIEHWLRTRAAWRPMRNKKIPVPDASKWGIDPPLSEV